MFLFNYSSLVDPLLRDVRAYVVELSRLNAGDKALDVCCGTGEQVFHYAQKGVVATGVDQDTTMIELAEKNRERHGFKDVTFQLADATELPFPDACFDCASISLGLHEMKREERAIAVSEMVRVVKKGGILMLVDFQVPLPRTPVSALIRIVEFLAGRDNYQCFKDYMQQGGLDALLEQSDLEVQKRGKLKHGLFTVIKTENPLLLARE